MIDIEKDVAYARAIKKRFEIDLLKKKHVVGVGIGFKNRNGQATDTVAIVVNVQQKVDAAALQPHDLIPETLEGVPLDVVEVGTIKAL